MDYIEKSFASAAETSKLLITLATALVAFSAAIFNAKTGDVTLFTPASTNQKCLLALSCVALVITTAIGIWTQLAITHVLALGASNYKVTVWSRKIMFPFALQIVTFALAVALLGAYAISRIFE